MPTLPALTTRQRLDGAIELHVSVAADDDVRLDARQDLRQLSVRCQPREDRLVARRGGVAEEDAAEPVDVELDGEREPRQELHLFGRQLLAHPVARVAVAVAADELRARLAHAGERLGRLSTQRDVAAADDRVRVDVGEDGVERGQVAVDVGEDGDPSHAANSRSRVPAQTRSRAGQPAHVNSLGVGRNSPARMRSIAPESSSSSCESSARRNVRETTASACSRKW